MEQDIKPARRRGLATHIPSLPDLKLGYAEKERQAADQRIADRKPKSGYIALIPIIHFSIGIAHFTWDEHSDDQGSWTAANHQWSDDEDNRLMTSDSLQHSVLFHVARQSKRANLKKWIYPDTCGEKGEWSLGHTNPTKSSPREIATWDDARMLSTVIDSGPYEQKAVPGTTRKLVSLWLYWTPDQPPTPERDEPPTPTPRKRKKGIKVEHSTIKAEDPLVKPKVKDEPPPTPSTVRRYRSGGAIIVAATSAAKRSGATVTRRAQASASDTDTAESGGEGNSEGEGEGEGEGISDPRGSEDLKDLKEMLDEAEKPTD